MSWSAGCPGVNEERVELPLEPDSPFGRPGYACPGVLPATVVCVHDDDEDEEEEEDDLDYFYDDEDDLDDDLDDDFDDDLDEDDDDLDDDDG